MMIKEHNAREDVSFKMAINRFADMSQEEHTKNAYTLENEEDAGYLKAPRPALQGSVPPINWKDRKKMTNVIDQ